MCEIMTYGEESVECQQDNNCADCVNAQMFLKSLGPEVFRRLLSSLKTITTDGGGIIQTMTYRDDDTGAAYISSLINGKYTPPHPEQPYFQLPIQLEENEIVTLS